MDEAVTTALEKPTQPAWTKRHQGAIAILGAVLATTSYFGKDYALARWNDRASSIKTAEANDDAVNTTASLDQRIGGMERDLGVLVADALAVEQHRDPHAQLDRQDSTQAASLVSRNGSVGTTLWKCFLRLKSLQTLDGATNPKSPHREELKALLQDVNKKRMGTVATTITSVIDSNPLLFGPSTTSANEQAARSKQMELLQQQTSMIESRLFELASIIRDEAEAQRARYVSYGQRTTVVLSVVFVLGLLLSLVGKLSGSGS